jgi:hypothetical protein
MDPPPPPQHLVDEVERARMSARGRYRGSFSRRMATSPAWAGMIPQPPRPRLTDAQRSAVEAAFADCADSDEEEYAAGVAAAAVAAAGVAGDGAPPEPPIGVGGPAHITEEEAVDAAHMQLNAQRAAAFMSAARAYADAAVEDEMKQMRRAEETKKRAARRKRHREALAAAEAAKGAGSST